MAFRSNINGQIRGFYFAASGNNDFNGQSLETPKLTIQAAINEASALSPPPSGANIALVTAAQGGSFIENFVLTDFVQFNGEDTTVSASSGDTITLASGLRCRLINASNLGSGNVFDVTGLSNIGIFIGRCGVGTGNAVAISGTVTDVFVTFNDLDVTGIGGTGISITSTNIIPVDINIDVCQLEADNTTFINYNAATSASECVLRVSSIDQASNTGTSAFVVSNGILAVESTGDIRVDSAILVQSGGVLRITATHIVGTIVVESGGLLQINAVLVEGAITVESGGTMEAMINSQTGTITNNGTLVGQINSTFYGEKNFLGIDKPDTDKLVSYRNTGLNGGGTDHYFTTRAPNGNIEVLPGSVAFREDGIDTDIYLNKGAALNNDKWKRLVTGGGIGDISFEGNGAATVISFPNTYVPINTVSPWLLSPLSEDFVLHTDSKSLKCISDIPIKVLITQGVLLSSGPIETYEVAIFLNNVLVPRSTFTIEIRQGRQNVSHTYFDQVTNGDLLEMRVQNIATTSNPVIIEAYLTVTKVS